MAVMRAGDPVPEGGEQDMGQQFELMLEYVKRRQLELEQGARRYRLRRALTGGRDKRHRLARLLHSLADRLDPLTFPGS